MNPMLGYLVERPGLLAGGMPILLLACLGAVQYRRQGRRAETRPARREDPSSVEDSWPPPPDSIPYYHSLAGVESQSLTEQAGDFLKRVCLWIADLLCTHLAVSAVLGAVVLGGLAVIYLLSHLKFTGAWAVLVGVALFAAYLVLVGIVILAVNVVSERALRGT